MRSSTAGKLVVFLSLAAVTAAAGMLLRDEIRDLRRQYHDLKTELSSPVPPPAAPPAAPLPTVLGPAAPDSSRLALPELKVESPDILRISFSPKLPTLPKEDQYAVRQDGTIRLGDLGTVSVGGSTPRQIAETVRKSAVALNPHVKVSVEVAGDHSQIFHVIAQVGEAGEKVTPLPMTGQLTAAEAVAKTGLKTAPTWRVWIDRPAINGQAKILRVDWEALSRSGESPTNYRLQPGDRLHIQSAD